MLGCIQMPARRTDCVCTKPKIQTQCQPEHLQIQLYSVHGTFTPLTCIFPFRITCPDIDLATFNTRGERAVRFSWIPIPFLMLLVFIVFILFFWKSFSIYRGCQCFSVHPFYFWRSSCSRRIFFHVNLTEILQLLSDPVLLSYKSIYDMISIPDVHVFM